MGERGGYNNIKIQQKIKCSFLQIILQYILSQECFMCFQGFLRGCTGLARPLPGGLGKNIYFLVMAGVVESSVGLRVVCGMMDCNVGHPTPPPPLLNYHFKPSSFILTPHYAMFGARSNATSGLGILYALSREKNQICLGRQHDRILPPKFDHKVNPVQTIKGLDNLRFSC